MFGQDALEVRGLPSSSGHLHSTDPTPPPPDCHTIHDSKQSDASESPYQHESAAANKVDNNPEGSSKSSKAKSSDTLRRSQACLACRKRKLRCDAKKPTCTRCEKAWLAYHTSAGEDGTSSERPPPCAYDTSLLAKIFRRGSSDDSTQPSTSRSTASRRPDTIHEPQNEQLLEENEQLHVQLSQLRAQLGRDETVATSTSAYSSSKVRSDPQQAGPSTTLASKVSIRDLAGDARDATLSSKRPGPFDDDGPRMVRKRGSLDTAMLPSQPTTTGRDNTVGSASRPYDSSITESPERLRSSAVAPTVLSWRAAVPQPVAAPILSGPLRPHSTDPNERLPRRPSLALSQSKVPPLPGAQALDRLVEVCRRESWLFSAINGYALSDVAALVETTADAESDVVTARSLMLACVATGLPLLVAAAPAGIKSSPTLASINDLLAMHAQSELVSLESPRWIATVTKIYADGARHLLNQAQRSAGVLSPATFLVRLLLVEISHALSAFSSAQADLAAAISESRLLRLQSGFTGGPPHLSTGPARSSHLARALRGLMQNKEETFAFWSLFLHDCVHSRVALLPVLLERKSIQLGFPRSTDSEVLSPSQRSLHQVDAHLNRRRGCPSLQASDDSMSLLVKVTLVLDQCCDYNLAARSLDSSISAREEHDKAFVAAHESIRNSRMMLAQFDDRTVSRSGLLERDASRSVVPSLLLSDRLRFAAEAAHHLSVLTLFETEVDVANPYIPGGEARGMLANAAVWLSRLAGMAMQNQSVLCSLPTLCSPALFVAARWLLYLQAADPDGYRSDLSALVLALSTRGQWHPRDQSLAKAVVALQREAQTYGRICISPFTWPIEAVSEFVPLPAQDAARRSRQQSHPQTEERSFVTIASLAASVDDAAVMQLVDAATRPA